MRSLPVGPLTAAVATEPETRHRPGDRAPEPRPAGAATALVTFLVGRRFLSAPAGLIGAVVLAVSPVHVANSHFATNDVPMAFFAVLAYVFLWDVYSRGRGRDYVAAGVAIGLGIGT